MDFSQCSCSGKSLNRLLQPAVMAVLAKEAVHGYLISQRLRQMTMFSAQPPHPTGIYRLLKSMENAGLVVSTWDLGDTGPAKRRYRLTRQGKNCLATWIQTLEEYEQAVAELLATLREIPQGPYAPLR